MAVSGEKILPWKDHLHVTLLVGVQPIVVDIIGGNLKTAALGLLVEVCCAYSRAWTVRTT